jgi:hypothetical protein
MRKNAFFIICAMVALLASSCAKPAGTEPAEETTGFKPVASVKEIMDNIVDPNADELWESVSTTIDINGITERYPRTDEEWKAVRNNAIALVEAPNLLMMPRPVAGKGDKSQNPEIELEPEQIEKLIDADRATFRKLALDLQDKAIIALKAIDSKDKDALSDIGGPIDEACENCHLKYWYPNEAKNRLTPQQAPTPIDAATEKKPESSPSAPQTNTAKPKEEKK